MRLIRVTPPVQEPLAPEEVQLYRREDSATELPLLTGLIRAAREMVEEHTRTALVTQTWELRVDRFPCGSIRLPRPPVQSVESVKYIDSAGAEVTLAPTEYVLDSSDFPGVVRLAYGRSWPTTRDEPAAVRIRFVAGYPVGGTNLDPDPAANVPQAIKAAMQLMIGTLYEHREGIITGTIVDDNPAVKALLGPYRYLEAY